MNWYNYTKTADNVSFIKSLGIAGVIAALAFHYNMSKDQAKQLIEQDPIKVQEILQNIPKTPVVQKPNIQNKQVQTNKEDSNGFLQKQIEKHEGKRNLAYKDTLGNMTVGIGFNLERGDARQIIENLGANYDKVYNKQQALNDSQINILYNINLKEAEQVAQNFISNFNEQPQSVQDILINMSFNLGPQISKFKKFKTALESKDYQKAAFEMQNSRWYHQVKNRGIELTNQMKKVSLNN